MNAEELMIGDWVKISHLNKIGKVYRIIDRANGKGNGFAAVIDGYFHESLLEPIPITPEIFEKNGFRKMKWESNSYVNSESEAAYICFSIGDYTNLWGGGDQDYVWVTIKYVHQLQHALRFCGIETEIVL